jgi:carbon storage regulator
MFCAGAEHTNERTQPMLVLSRKAHESIVIGDDIVITVNWIKSDKVSIGIDAPLSVNIRRSEVPKQERKHGKEAD